MSTSDLPEGTYIDRDGNPTTYPPNTWPQQPLPLVGQGDRIRVASPDSTHEGIVRKVHADGTMDIDWHIA